MNITRFTSQIVLLVMLGWTAGCATHPDPLAGWKVDFDHQPDQVIVNDYQDYIQKIPLRQRGFVGSVDWLGDGMGQHAIDIKIGVNGTWRDHVLIYDKENKRIKVIKYSNGGYRS
jgi:hypothetical protein